MGRNKNREDSRDKVRRDERKNDGRQEEGGREDIS